MSEVIDMECPECGSDDLSYSEYDFGRDPETGYRDAGERFACRNCGEKGDVRDAEVRSRGNKENGA